MAQIDNLRAQIREPICHFREQIMNFERKRKVGISGQNLAI